MKIEAVSVELFQVLCNSKLKWLPLSFLGRKILPGVKTGFRAPVDGFCWFQSSVIGFGVLKTHPWEWNFKRCPYSWDMRCFGGVLKPRKHFFKFCSQQSILMYILYIFYIQSFISFVMFELQNGFPGPRPLAQPQAVAGSERGWASFGRALPVPSHRFMANLWLWWSHFRFSPLSSVMRDWTYGRNGTV